MTRLIIGTHSRVVPHAHINAMQHGFSYLSKVFLLTAATEIFPPNVIFNPPQQFRIAMTIYLYRHIDHLLIYRGQLFTR